MSERTRAVLWWSLVILYLAVIITAWARPEFSAEYAIRWLSRELPGASTSQIRLIVAGGRKVAHFVGYFAFTIVLANALVSTSPAPASRGATQARIALAALGAIGLATLDEVRQSISPFRTGASADIAVDTAGIALAVVLLICVCGRLRRR
jgi:VanZ family protein